MNLHMEAIFLLIWALMSFVTAFKAIRWICVGHEITISRDSSHLFSTYGSHSSYLHLFHHLFPKRADFSGGGDDHIFGALVLTRNAVEEAAVVLQVDAQICLQNQINQIDLHKNKHVLPSGYYYVHL